MKCFPTAVDSTSPALLQTCRFLIGAAFGLCLGTAAGAADVTQFPNPYNTRETNSQFLRPEEAVKTFRLPPGFEATLFAGEPDVQQPIGMTMDRRGRIWVAENYTYSEKPRSWDTNLSDRIVILEDTNHDGHFDKRTVFWDQAKKLTSVAVGFGGVFALCPPQLLFIPDRNGDDVPDAKPEVLLDGFEDTVVWHNIANGLKLGPDGWIYGRQGIQGISQIGPPSAAPEQRIGLNAGIWRFHPVTHRFEVVAQGTTNPWGADWDENGQLFFINTVIGHFWHVIPGAFYKRMYGAHPRPHLYELIDQTADHFHWDTREAWSKIREIGVSPTTSQAGGGHAHCGMMIYLGDSWPEQYRNSMFTVNFHGKRLNNDTIERQGASYTAHHAPDLLSVGDPWFRGIDLFYGPAGEVYLSDWSDTGECHDSDAIHRTSGRIYRITYGEPTHNWSGDVAEFTDKELVDMQLHHNDWFVRQARQVLQERAARGLDMKGAYAALHRMFDQQKDVPRKLRALWALYVTGGSDEAWLRELLKAQNEQLRVWAIQLLVDQAAPSAAVLAAFTQMAQSDSSGLVLSFLASALQHVPVGSRWPLALALAGRSEFAEDRVLPLMIWYGIEPAVPGATVKAVDLARETRIPKLRQFVARRIFEDLASAPAAAETFVRILQNSSDPEFQTNILNGMSESLVGVQKPVAPPSWAQIWPVLASSPNPVVAYLAQELSALFGDPKALASLRAIVAESSATAAARRNALRILVQVRAPELTPLLVPLLENPELAADAIRALASTGDPQTPAILLQKYSTLRSEGDRIEVVNTLSSRSTFVMPMLEAVHLGVIPRKEVTATQLQQLRSLQDPDVDSRVKELWPQLDESPAGKKQLFARYRDLLTPARVQSADPAAGHKVFQQTCGVCHTLYGEGAKLGPELTGADRHNLDYLLDNILNPSAVVPENYRAWVISLKDDRVLNGIIVSQSDKLITLQTTSEQLVLQRSDVESTHQSQLSTMPEGLLQGLTDAQACDLVSYLMSSGPVSAPADRK
jgi:putative membrane-bound dehydrogenase-like protein